MPALRGFSMRVARGAMVEPGRPQWRRQDHADALDHGPPQAGAGRRPVRRSRSGRPRPRHARAALGIGYMPEDRCLVPQLTVEENILLPLWVAEHLDRKARLDFVYEVIGELTEMRHRKALLLSGGQQKLVALGRALAHRHQMPAARRTVRGNSAGIIRAALRGACLAERQESDLADVAIGPEPLAWPDRRRIHHRARRQSRPPHSSGCRVQTALAALVAVIARSGFGQHLKRSRHSAQRWPRARGAPSCVPPRPAAAC